MLRLASAELIFTNEPPVVVEGIEVDDVPEATVTTESKQDSTRQASQPDEQIDKPGSTPECATASDQQPTQNHQEQSTNNPSGDTPLIMTQSASDDTEISLQDVLSTKSISGTAKKTKRTNNPSKPDGISEQVIVHQSEADRIDSARNWLYAQGLAGTWLIQLAAEINAGRLQWGVDLLETQDKWLLPFPGSAQTLDVEPNLFIKTLEEKGWLVTDILSPMRKVQVINQVRGVLLATEPSGFLKQLLAVCTLPVTTSSSSLPSEITHQAPVKNKKTKRPSIKRAKSEKSHDQQQSSITDKPEVLSQHSPPSLLTGSPAVMAMINHLRKTRPVAETASTDSVWHSVEESDIAQCLTQHPGLKRSALLREMASHPDCRIDEGGINVRLSP